MKITCDRAKLLRLVSLVSSAASNKTTIDVLKNIKFVVAESGDVSLMAYDMEIGIRVNDDGFDVSCDGAGGGEFLLNPKILLPILRESNDETISIEIDGNNARIFGNRSNYNVFTESPEQYPDVASFNDKCVCVVRNEQLHDLIQRTMFATDTESSRYALGGVRIETLSNEIIFVATDGRRLSCQTALINGGVESDAVVPIRTLQLIDKSIDDSIEYIDLSITDKTIAASIGDITIRSNLVEGRYPRWRDVIPATKGMNLITVEAGSFLSAVRQAAILVNRDKPGIVFAFEHDNIRMETMGASSGSSKIDFPIDYKGNETKIRLDETFLVDFLRVLDPFQSFNMYFTSNDVGVVFETNDGLVYTIMPLTMD